MRAEDERLKALMAEGLDGDPDAYAGLLRALAQVLRAFYRRRLANEDVAEDLVQETLIAIHRRRATYDRGRPFPPWLYSIARHKLIDHLRRSREARLSRPIDELAEVLGDGGFGEAVDAAVDVGTMLATLPSKQARAVRSTRLEGRSVAETARVIGISESDVKVSVHRGLKALSVRFG